MLKQVLVAEEDLHEHKLIHDILGISIKDVKITRALNAESFIDKAMKNETPWDLILYDFHFDERSGSNALLTILRAKPELASDVVLLNGSAQEIKANPLFMNLPYILKPFSLDNFSEVVKRISA